MKKFKLLNSFTILVIGILVGIQLSKILFSDDLGTEMAKIHSVLQYTKDYYVEKENTQKLAEEAIKGILSKLDPHSIYIPASDITSVEESFRGDFEGIGIEFQIVNDTLTVVSPITGGPSESLGILSGDRIIKINGKNAIGITNDEVRKKLRGKSGTKVKITVLRLGMNSPIEYEITRAKIPLSSVDTHLMLNNETGFISISRFSEKTFEETYSALKDLQSKGMKNLIVDLRGNPGGYLNQAVQVADLFIDGNKKIVYTKGRLPDFNDEYDASVAYPFEKMPLVILVNKGSASASEIVSGAVQDWDRGLIVGETTFGKGLVQRQFTLADNSAIRLTISKYFTPSGRLIQRDYTKYADTDEYYEAVKKREEIEGENLFHLEEQDSSKPKFKTPSGRLVYGGGGITPDYIIKSTSVTKYTTDLMSKNIFYLFMLNYVNRYNEVLTSKYGKNLQKFLDDFSLNQTDINSFIRLAESKNIPFVKKDFEIDKKFILMRIKAQIARNYWKNEGWYSVLLKVDDQLIKAMELIPESKKLAGL